MNELNSATVVEIHRTSNISPSAYPSVRTQSESSTLSAPRCRICWITSEEADLYSTCYCKEGEGCPLNLICRLVRKRAGSTGVGETERFQFNVLLAKCVCSNNYHGITYCDLSRSDTQQQMCSIGKVHLSCLERWLQESRTDFCDLCFYDYTLEKSPRYSVLGSILPFWRNAENKRRCKQLLAAIPGITFLVILAAGCCLLAFFALDDMKPDMVDNTYSLLKAVLLFCLILILAIYGSLFLSLFDDLHDIWKTWRNSEQVVRLVLSKSSSEGKSPSSRSVLERQ